jgi:Domain of unknown function (DUF4258)
VRPSTHALKRMAERGITVAEMTEVIDDPDVTFTDRKGNPCYIRLVGGRRIKVVLAADDTNFVVTVIDLDA